MEFRIGQRVKAKLEKTETLVGNEHDHVGVVCSRDFQKEKVIKDDDDNDIIISERWLIHVIFGTYRRVGVESGFQLV